MVKGNGLQNRKIIGSNPISHSKHGQRAALATAVGCKPTTSGIRGSIPWLSTKQAGLAQLARAVLL